MNNLNQLKIDIEEMVSGLDRIIHDAEHDGNVLNAMLFFTNPQKNKIITTKEREKLLRYITPEQARVLLTANSLMLENLAEMIDTAENVLTIPAVINNLKKVRDDFQKIADELPYNSMFLCNQNKIKTDGKTKFGNRERTGKRI